MKKIIKYFEEISKIPRGSKNEKEISDFLVDFAKKRNLEVYQDEYYNVLIKKDASKGYENEDTLILQGHIDMVCEKNKDTMHDFKKDPIKLKYEGNFLTAEGTTLGADNGIAVAYAMAILDDISLKHPALEIFLTADEETGMTGAENFDYSKLEGKKLINLDSEEEGEILVSCAGGVRKSLSKDITYEKNTDKTYKIVVKGLKGGHSGDDIDKNRDNAIKMIGRVLKDLHEKEDIKISHIEGGSKDNAIPREAEAIITSPKCLKFESEIPNISIMEIETAKKVIKETRDIVNIIDEIINGVYKMSKDVDGLVETSNNLGIIKIEDGKIILTNLTRSSNKKSMNELNQKTINLAKKHDFSIEFNSEYPAWEYKKESEIREKIVEVYYKMYNKKPLIKAIHAGLECGIFSEKIKNIDMISLGPDMFDVHTPDERLDIKSAERTYELLLKILEEK